MAVHLLGGSMLTWVLCIGLLIPAMAAPLSSSLCGNRCSHHGTPPSHHGGGTTPSHGGKPPSRGHGSPPAHSTPSNPSPGNCGTPPSTPSNPPTGGGGGGGGGYYPSPSPPTPTTPYTPTPSTPNPPYTPTPSTPNPPYTPTPSTPNTPYTPTPSTPTTPYTPTPSTPTTPSPPYVPVDPNSPFPCNYWRNHPAIVWGLVGWWGTVGSAFGVTSLPGIGSTSSTMSLQQLLSNTRTDGYGALYREGTASLLNSMVTHKFPFTTMQVRDRFISGLSSNKAAAAQARLFKLANEAKLT